VVDPRDPRLPLRRGDAPESVIRCKKAGRGDSSGVPEPHERRRLRGCGRRLRNGRLPSAPTDRARTSASPCSPNRSYGTPRAARRRSACLAVTGCRYRCTSPRGVFLSPPTSHPLHQTPCSEIRMPPHLSLASSAAMGLDPKPGMARLAVSAWIALDGVLTRRRDAASWSITEPHSEAVAPAGPRQRPVELALCLRVR
jgi:hypothetical protein